MKPISPELVALFATRQFIRMDLYTFILADGVTTLRYCAGDISINYNGNFFPTTVETGPYFDRRDNKAKLHQKVGVETDTLVFDVLPGSATINSIPFREACNVGIFDGAELRLDRVYMSTPGDTRAGGINVFFGRVTDVDVDRSIVTFSVNSWLELLNLPFPRNIIQPGCLNNLGDSTCQVNLASFTTTGTAASGCTKSLINTTLTIPSVGYYDLGVVKFTSGQNLGLTAGVQTATASLITLQNPFPFAPANGDTFSLTAGCDKTSGFPLSSGTNGASLISGTNVATLSEPLPGLAGGMPITGTGVPINTTILTVDGTEVVMSANATITGQTTLTFGTSQNGCIKFANQARFRGFPFGPTPEVAV